MKKSIIIANWKSNKTIYQAEEWFKTINNLLASRRSGQLTINNEEKKVIVCAPFTLFPKVKESTVNCQLSIAVGAQDISPFEEGAYTGEVNGKQIKEYADYVIIGHSERRKNFLESNDLINLKIEQAFKYDLIPIICVSNLEQVKSLQVKNDKMLIAYEPLFAIGSGIADTPKNADQMAKSIKDVLGEIPVLYGGSVTSKNISEFSKMPNINGVLVGKASLNPLEFLQIVKNA